MSTLQVANIHLESTANNRIQYTGSNSFNIVAGGSNTLTVNSTVVVANAAMTISGALSVAGALSGAAGAIGSSGTGKLTAYTSPGTWSNSAPNLKAVKVTVVGGGGAGGGGGTGPTGSENNPISPASYYGGSGGGGGFSVGVYPVAANPALSAPVTVTVGAGGANSPAPASGGTSSFGSLISATGGGAGGNSPGSASSTTNGAGGTGTGGDWNVTSSNGSTGFTDSGVHPFGGKSLLSMISLAGWTPSTPGGTFVAQTGISFGGGASGSRRTSNTAQGAAGIVIVEEFY